MANTGVARYGTWKRVRKTGKRKIGKKKIDIGERSWSVSRCSVPRRGEKRVGKVPPPRVFCARSSESIETKGVVVLVTIKEFART